MNEQIICIKCNLPKDPDFFHKTSSIRNGKQYYRKECKDCVRAYLRSDAAREAQKRYRAKKEYREVRNTYRKTEKAKIATRLYENTRSKTDPLYKLKKNLRDRLTKALKAKSWHKTTKFNHYIGCSIEELKKTYRIKIYFRNELG